MYPTYPSYDVRKSFDLFQWNDFRAWNWPEVLAEFDRREILEHEIPLPPLGRIRRLQPVARRNRARKRDIRERRVAGHRRELLRDRLAHRGRRRVADWRAEDDA